MGFTQVKRSEFVAQAESFVAGKRLESFPAQCELVSVLKSAFGLRRDEIALVTDLTPRQVKTRLNTGLTNSVAKGLIPSVEFLSVFAPSKDFGKELAEEKLADEIEKRESSKLGGEARSKLNTWLFTEKLAEAIARQLPSADAVQRIDELAMTQVVPVWLGEGEARSSALPVAIAVANQSDAHFFLSTHGSDFAKTKAANDVYYDKVIDLTYRKRLTHRIDTLHMNLLGDNLQGTANYEHQRWDTDRCAIDQAEALTKVYAENIARALLHFTHVVVNGMPGNHGKIVPKSSEPEHSNWETVVLRSLQWAFRDNPRVSFNLTDDWYQVVPIFNEKFLLTHGHAMAGAGNYETVVSTIRKWQDTLEYFDYVVIGHFHRQAKLPLTRNKQRPKHRYVFMNGCYPTHDSFIEKFGSSHTNLQWFFFVDERGVCDAIDIELYGGTNGSETLSANSAN